MPGVNPSRQLSPDPIRRRAVGARPPSTRARRSAESSERLAGPDSPGPGRIILRSGIRAPRVRSPPPRARSRAGSRSARAASDSGDDDAEADAHVEGLVHLRRPRSRLRAASSAKIGCGSGKTIEHEADVRRRDARQVQQAVAGDVRERPHRHARRRAAPSPRRRRCASGAAAPRRRSRRRAPPDARGSRRRRARRPGCGAPA